MLITIEEAAAHLRIDDLDAELALLEGYIRAAGSAIKNYIGSNMYKDEQGTEVKEDVKSACLLLVGDLYRAREGQEITPSMIPSYANLTQGVVSLLYPYRRPVTA